MPYCPKCRDEFHASVKTCPDCGADLVTELTSSDRNSRRAREPLVHIANAPNEMVARMWMGLLENNGVRSTMKGGVRRWAGYDSLFVPYDIYVLVSDAERAREVLDGLPDSKRPS